MKILSNNTENILTQFLKTTILQIDDQGNVKKVILDTNKGKNTTKNIYDTFLPLERERLTQLIQYPSSQIQYLTLKNKKNIGIKIQKQKEKTYIQLTPTEENKEKILSKREIEELKDLSQTDQLTKVLNRHGLINKAQKLITSIDPFERIGMVFVDIDGLKQINDKHGHDAGDETIFAVANMLKQNTRSRDLVIRLGGDEFLILVEEVSGKRSTVYGLAEKLLRKVQKTDLPYSVTMSMGVHVFRARKIQRCMRENANFEDCILGEVEYADQAVYKAKEAGKNQIAVSTNFKRYYKTLSNASE